MQDTFKVDITFSKSNDDDICLYAKFIKVKI
jgi:hypothetical protein